MFSNIGKKIKILAQIFCIVGIIASVITAITMFARASDAYYTEELFIALGFVFLIVGPLVSWVSSFALYGFGELIDNSQIIAETVAPDKVKKSSAATQKSTERPAPVVLPELLQSGLITREEYLSKQSKNAQEEE